MTMTARDLSEDTQSGSVAPVTAFSEVTFDPVRDYLRAVGRTRLLTGAEETDLARRIEVGLFAGEKLATDDDLAPKLRRELSYLARDGQVAYSTFIQSNLRLVVSIAKRYAGRGLPLMDLIQEGNLGLVRAVEKFDYTSGNKFSTYATWWIRQSILRGLADTARTIRIPVHTVEKIDRLDRIRRDLTGQLGRTPTIEELSEESTVSPAEIATLQRSDAKMVSLAAPIGDESDAELGDVIPDEAAEVPFETIEASFRHRDIQQRLDALPPRDRNVVQLRFGLDGSDPMTLDEVGAFYGITRERVRQLETRSLKRMRCAELRDYLV